MSTPLLVATVPFLKLGLGLLIGVPLSAVPIFWLKREIDAMFAEEAARSRSPFSEKLLRPAGESLRLKIDEIREKTRDQHLTLALYLCAPGGLAILLSGLGTALMLIIVTIIAVITFPLAAKQWSGLKKIREELQNYRLGFDGERYVAAELEPLMARGYRVFHDFIFDMKPGGEKTTFNIDHIAIGPEGVFALETKARRKPHSATNTNQEPHEVIFTGSALRFPNGYEDERSIKQALDAAKDLSDWLSGSSKKRIDVMPVVIIPGWFIQWEGQGPVRVISGKRVARQIPQMGLEAALDQDEVQRLSDRIEDHCRNIEGT